MPSALPPNPILGLLTEPAAGALAVLVGCTTLAGGAAHYGATLARKPKHDADFITGVGFFIGMAVGFGLLLFDAIS